MIESLEPRQLFSKTPLLLYPAPSSVASDALSIINATPTEVVASAAEHVASGQAASQAMLDVIEYHEGYSLSIYPDASGVPTVGVGLKLDSSHASFATVALNAAGVNYSDLVQDWNSIKSLWVSQHHPLASLKDTSPLWALFVERNPSVANLVLTALQASTAFDYTVTAKITAAAAFFGSQFYLLDRDPQIALADLAYHVADITQFTKLAAQIQGNAQQATNYTDAAKQITLHALDSRQRARDDQDLVKHGEDFSSIVINPSSVTLYLDETAAVTASPTGAFGKNIVLPTGDLKWSESVGGIVHLNRIKAGLNLHSLRFGTTDLSVTANPSLVTATALITVLPVMGPATVNWQTTGTFPDVDGYPYVDGTFSEAETVQYDSYFFGPHGPLLYELDIQTMASGSQNSQGQLNLDLTVGGLYSPLAVGSYSQTSITLGESIFFANSVVNITSLDLSTGFVAGTFSAASPYAYNQATVATGSISGSFSGVFSE